MQFNMSRFLVRVRQFFTRDRLVKVLGVTAIFLFLLNFSNFMSHQILGVPLVATHVMGNQYHDADRYSEFSRFFSDGYLSQRSRCWKKQDHARRYEEVYNRRVKEKELELRAKEQVLENMLKHHEIIQEQKSRKIVIKKRDNSSSDYDVSIMIDGEVVDLSRVEKDI